MSYEHAVYTQRHWPSLSSAFHESLFESRFGEIGMIPCHSAETMNELMIVESISIHDQNDTSMRVRYSRHFMTQYKPCAVNTIFQLLASIHSFIWIRSLERAKFACSTIVAGERKCRMGIIEELKCAQLFELNQIRHKHLDVFFFEPI